MKADVRKRVVLVFGALVPLLAMCRGTLYLAFDDRYLDSWVKAVPTFARHKAHATFFVSGEIDGMALAAMKELSAAGHSLGLHGLKHRVATEAVVQEGADGYLRNEILPQTDALVGCGFPVLGFAYPNSRADFRTHAALGRKFDRLRVGGYWEYSRAGRLAEADPLYYPGDTILRQGVLISTSLPACRPTRTGEVARVLHRLAARDESIVLYAHDIRTDDGPHDDHHVKLWELEAILETAQALGVAVRGFDEMIEPDLAGPVKVGLPGRGYAVTVREIFIDRQKDGRSGHMGHALVDAGGGRILAFSSNVDGQRCAGHSGYGWMEYRVSDDYGRTFGPLRTLACSKRAYEEGKHTLLCEKAVRTPDGQILLFFQVTDQSKPICCEPWSAPTMCLSADRGETWSDPVPTGAKPGRIYDAVSDDRDVWFLQEENPHFLGTSPEHVYRVYRRRGDGTFAGVTLPIDAKGKGYGALEIGADGALYAYAYDSTCEVEMEYCVSRDCGETWSAPAKSVVPMRIRNPQIRRLDDTWFCIGRNGGSGFGDGLVMYLSSDGVNWDAGRMIDRRPKGQGTGYYSCLLPIREPGHPPRMLMQYSHVYRANCVNIVHRMIVPDLPIPPASF